MSKNAFTLVELLVTIAIIAILIAVSLVSYDNLTKNARDSQRKSDLKQIQSALEQYYRDNTAYPSLSDGLDILSGTRKYINQVPAETVTDNLPYNYVPSCVSNCTSYCLYATMEQGSNAGFVSSTACNDSSKGNYSVTQP